MSRRRGVCVVVIVPPLAKGKQRHQPIVTGIIAGRESARAPHVCGRIDQPGAMQAYDDAEADSLQHHGKSA